MAITVHNLIRQFRQTATHLKQYQTNYVLNYSRQDDMKPKIKHHIQIECDRKGLMRENSFVQIRRLYD